MESSILKKLSSFQKISKVLERKILSTLLYNYSKENAVTVLNKLNREEFGYYSKAYDCLAESVKKEIQFTTLLIDKGVSISDLLSNESINSSVEFEKSINELKKVSNSIGYIESSILFLNNINYSDVESQIAEFSTSLIKVSHAGNGSSAKETVKSFENEQNTYQEKYKNGQKYLGTPTGFEMFDSMTEGIRDGRFYVIGGYSGIGKTTFALNIADSFLRQGKRVLIYSLEMSSDEIAIKIMSKIAGINSLKMIKGNLKESELAEVDNAKCIFYDYDIVIYDDILDFDKIKLSIIQENMKKKVDLVIIDYLQMVSSTHYKSEYERMSVFPNELKVEIARKLDIPVIALSQISNEEAKNPNDITSGYKGSGAIEAASDLGMKFVYDEKREDRDVKKQQGLCINVSLAITKQRFGISGGIQMSFDGSTGRFYEGHDIKLNKIL